MRQGELLGLRWEDVSLERAELVVRHSMTRLPGPKGTRYVLTPPKTARSRRTVPLLPWVVEALRTLRKSQVGATHEPDALQQGLVFCTQHGSPLEATKVTRRFNASLEAAGVRRVRFHDLRHTAASLMIESGMDLATVSGILGHSGIAITVDTYGHLTVKHRREAMERYGEMMA